jgi:translation initiation factor 1
MGNRKKSAGGHSVVYSTDPDFSYDQGGELQQTPPPTEQRLRTLLDTKHRKGKIVTLVEGFTGQKEDLETLGKKLKTACGTGGSAKEDVIIIQGDHLRQVKDLLKSWGYGLK